MRGVAVVESTEIALNNGRASRLVGICALFCGVAAGSRRTGGTSSRAGATQPFAFRFPSNRVAAMTSSARRILIADDQADILHALRLLLDDEGYDVTAA